MDGAKRSRGQRRSMEAFSTAMRLQGTGRRCLGAWCSMTAGTKTMSMAFATETAVGRPGLRWLSEWERESCASDVM